MIDTQGKLLIAPPNMPDPRFRKTVVYIWRHDVSGAAGVVINKKCQQPDFKHICNEGLVHRLPKVNHPVYYGGPILTNVVGVLHSTEYTLSSTNTLAEGQGGIHTGQEDVGSDSPGRRTQEHDDNTGHGQLDHGTAGGRAGTPQEPCHELAGHGLR